MIPVGIFTGYYPCAIDETIRRIKEQGFSCVQLDVSFKDCDATKGELTDEKAERSAISSATPTCLLWLCLPTPTSSIPTRRSGPPTSPISRT